MTPDVMRWGGDPRNEEHLAPFLRRGDRMGSRVIWWLEPDFEGRVDLLVTREAATAEPLRVRPGGGLRLLNGEFSLTTTAGSRSRRTARTEGS
jgi:hypothetical protein